MPDTIFVAPFPRYRRSITPIADLATYSFNTRRINVARRAAYFRLDSREQVRAWSIYVRCLHDVDFTSIPIKHAYGSCLS